ncbi:MAG: MBL fold metallo-hydrolase [Acidimicrobiia bacterium]|nr:MBL fold metallo-hydrolase [Acidimicrobiia bacterium]
MPTIRPLTRRVFLRRFGTTSLAIAVLGLGACSDSGETATTGDPTTTDQPLEPPTTQLPVASTAPDAPTTEAVRYRRVNLGFVSAYILIRAGSAAIVDTGVAGSAPDIEDGLTAVGLGWEDVEHLILTHRHNDHIGSAEAVLTAAASATSYAGEADISQIPTSRPIVAVGDGDEVFGLQIIHTPGHTDGHISVLDPAGGVLVAGDALNGAAGGVTGANPDFSSDMVTANETVRKLAGLTFDTVLFGHGEPVEGGAGTLVAALAAGL